jgi:hypothetical protein
MGSSIQLPIIGFTAQLIEPSHDQLAWTQEKGDEIILRKSDGAMLTPLAQGDMVFVRAMKEVTVGALSGRSNSLDRSKYVR